MKWMRYLKDEPDTIRYKYAFNGDFDQITFLGQKKQTTVEVQVPRKYQKKILISSAKKKDLIQLCKSGVIPNEYHEYYKSLPSSASSKDT